MVKKLCILAGIMISGVLVKAQDTLPAFSVVNKGNDRIIISWTNPYLDTIRQLSIQRSYDSLRNFKTILTLPDPTIPQNGYADVQPLSARMFYRLYILLDNGRYIFSKAKRPVIDITSGQLQKDPAIPKQPVAPWILKPAESFTPSRYVFTDRYGNVKVSLPDAASKKYQIKFLDENGTLIFELKEVRDTLLTLDKTNFIHAGWFRFDLYDGEELKENHKFFIPRDF
jgi:hypothetical protein